MENNIKFVELLAKTGVFFGAADGNYDDKERAFVNLFIGFLKVQAHVDGNVEEVVRKATEKSYTIDEIISETKNALAKESADEKAKTLASMANFINTIICIDGVEDSDEKKFFDQWKKELGVK